MCSCGDSRKTRKITGGGYGKLLIVGNGGHGRVVRELASQINCYRRIQFLDDDSNYKEDGSVLGGSKEVFNYKKECDVFIAIGDPGSRKRLQESYEAAGVSVISLIHPQANLPMEIPEIGRGTVVMAGATIQVGTLIGKGVIVNTAASIDHDCRIGDYVHIAVGAHLAGNVEVGNGTWIGAGAVVRNNVKICEDVMIGAGAVVVEDIVENGVYVGVPATKLT